LYGKHIKDSPFTAFIQDDESEIQAQEEKQNNNHEIKSPNSADKDEDDSKARALEQRLKNALQEMPGGPKNPKKKGYDDVRKSDVRNYRMGSGESDYSEEEYPERDYPDLDIERGRVDNGHYPPPRSDGDYPPYWRRGPPHRPRSRRYPDPRNYYDGFGYRNRGRPPNGRGRGRGRGRRDIGWERDNMKNERINSDERRVNPDEPPPNGFSNDYGGY